MKKKQLIKFFESFPKQFTRTQFSPTSQFFIRTESRIKVFYSEFLNSEYQRKDIFFLTAD